MCFRYTIVVPHYNNFQGLLNLISSIPQRSDIEIIIVDDSSEYRILNQLKNLMLGYNKLSMSLYLNDSGVKGAGSARNIGLKNATGKYLLFCDSDDYFVNNAFDIIDSKINRDDFDIYYFKPTSKCLISGEKSDRHIPYSKLIDDYLMGKNQNIRYKFYVPWSKVYLREYIIKNKFKFDQVIASNDVMFSLLSASKARVLASNETFYCVTRGVGTLTVNFSRHILSSRLKVSLVESKYIHDNNINVEKDSIYSLVKKSRFKLSLLEFKLIMNSYNKGYVRLFPESYSEYLTNPRKLYHRLLNKKPSIKNKKYQE
ncbi:glycosyltransferase family 2 protein [Shewanella phaeophyticola]|uniref:Glycosyltransferase n=1 Tax=Shewanella phaeophyticola TaxID=2978345 RepID=A0ABT2P6R7_9GAMM|nr:glycosyltransferase family 2 protein [Shewanella sp. KJ10-1]MCT8987055.1 glycosyltransferase [Shewanella sp. KJ10-1]